MVNAPGRHSRTVAFDLEERLTLLSAKGDGLERLGAVVNFELFRPELERAVPQTFGCLQRYRRLRVDDEMSHETSRHMTILASVFMTDMRLERMLHP